MLRVDGTLTFANVAVDNDVARAPQGYRARWFVFDNATGTSTLIGETSSRSTVLDAPADLPGRAGVYVKVELRSEGAQNAAWEKPVDAFFRMVGGEWRLIGFERMPHA